MLTYPYNCYLIVQRLDQIHAPVSNLSTLVPPRVTQPRLQPDREHGVFPQGAHVPAGLYRDRSRLGRQVHGRDGPCRRNVFHSAERAGQDIQASHRCQGLVPRAPGPQREQLSKVTCPKGHVNQRRDLYIIYLFIFENIFHVECLASTFETHRFEGGHLVRCW